MTQAIQHPAVFERLTKADEQARAERIADAIIQSFSAKPANDDSVWRQKPLEWREIFFDKRGVSIYVGFDDNKANGSIDVMEYQYANEEMVLGLTKNDHDWIYEQLIDQLTDEHNDWAAGDNYGDCNER